MLDKPISPLRQRMIDDMTARRFNEHTQRDYVRNVRMFAAFIGRSPDTAAKEDLRRFQLHMAKQQMSAVLLGHAKLETTALYTRVAVNTIRDVTRLGVNLARRPPPA